MAKTIITAALTGVLATRDQCAAIPYTAEEIAQEARRAVDAGASIVHIHARQGSGAPAFDVASYARIHAALQEYCPEVIVNYSTGAIGIDRSERIDHISQLKPELAALNMGSMNYALYSRKQKQFHHDLVFANPFEDIIYFLQAMNAAGVRPELECFDSGHVHNTVPLIDMGLLQQPLQFSLIMGVLGGIPATTPALVHQVQNLPSAAHWQVIGIGSKQWAMVAAAITLGGNIRVGLEDNFYLDRSTMADSNAVLVEKAARLVHDLGGQVASVAEAREILGIGNLAA